MNASMTSDHAAAAVDDLAFTRQTIARVLRFEVTIDETGVVAVGHETDFLRLFLLRNTDQMMLACRVARLRLRHLAQRKHRARQLRLRQFPEKVRLIFFQMPSAQQEITIRRWVKLDASVVSGGDSLAT